jgi:hypothetical protein
MVGTKYGYDENAKPILTKDPKLLLNDNNAGKLDAHASMPTARREDCRTPRSAPSRRRSTIRRRKMAGSSSA